MKGSFFQKLINLYLKTMENIKKGELLTTGKAKSLYESNEAEYLIMHYRDDTSAFDGKKD